MVSTEVLSQDPGAHKSCGGCQATSSSLCQRPDRLADATFSTIRHPHLPLRERGAAAQQTHPAHAQSQLTLSDHPFCGEDYVRRCKNPRVSVL